MLLIDDILLLPVKGFFGVLKKIHEMAEQELSDEGYIRERLMELQLRYELDEIGEDEYYRQEKELMQRLNESMKMNEGQMEG
ncbi:MAG: gas vesicle protein GvpG [Nitrospirae bacterium]|nr:gas vesicle protein GvpG [Nitrospirota bacterium]